MTKTVINLETGSQEVVALTEEEIAGVAAEQAAQAPIIAAQQAAKAAYDQASAVFETLSAGKRALWEPVRKAVGEAILAGDMPLALEILTTVPALYEGAEDDRLLFLSLFEPQP